MQYEVITTFTDLEDEKKTVYIAGKDKYPRNGLNPKQERIEALLNGKNKLGRPVIASAKASEPQTKNPGKASE